MAEKKIYLGSVGPYLFEDTDLIDDADGEFSGETRHAFTSNRQALITEEPTDDNELMRLGDSNSRILAPLAVIDINDPSAELAGKVGVPGTLILVYQINATRDRATLYEWETANSGGVDIPYVVAGSSGFWVAVVPTGNTLEVGDGTDTDKRILARNADANKPALRYNATTNEWEYSNDGVGYSKFSTATVADTEVAQYRIAAGESITIGDYEQIYLAELYIIEGLLSIKPEGILAIH